MVRQVAAGNRNSSMKSSWNILFAVVVFVCVGVGGVSGLDPCVDCEYYYLELYYPTQGMPLYSKPTFSAAGQLLYHFAPKIYPIHVFQIAGAGKIAAILKVLKPGVLQSLVVQITNLGMDISAEALYSFEAFALFAGAAPPIVTTPLRVLPCPRVYLLEMTISPSGNASDYRDLLGAFATELLHLRKANIILDIYKYLGTVPTTFMVLGCGTPTFFDQLTLSLATVADDFGSFEVGRVTSLAKWNPLMGGHGGACFWGMSAAHMFKTGKK